jgi:polyisoprenyl-phosphate glycosyltransferase
MEKQSTHLSIVSPVYQSEILVDELVARLCSNLATITDQFEIILIEDGGRDGSWDKIVENCGKDKRIKGIQLSRNFGQHSAIAAGLEAAAGEWVVVMDCDLQDRPEEIASLYRKAKEGYDIVLAQRIERRDTKHKQILSNLFYRGLSLLSGAQYDNTIANFGIYHQKIIEPLLQIQSSIQYFPTMVNWVGFKKATIPVEHSERPRGESSYNFRKKCSLALNIMLAYSDKPLKIIVAFGISISLMAFVFAIIIAYKALRGTISVLGYSSLIISVSFFSGVIISVLGVLGLYVGKIFQSIKAKPAYLVRRRINE